MKILLFFITLTLLNTTVQSQEQFFNVKVIEWEGKRDSILYENEYGSIYFSKKLPNKFIHWYQNDDSEEEFYSSFYVDFIAQTIDSFDIKYTKETTPFSNIIMTNLYNFNGEPCLYSPSDWFITANYKITDSTVLIMKSADPEFYIINNVTQKNKSTFEYELISTRYNYEYNEMSIEIENSQLTIEIINKEDGIYLWTWLTDNGKSIGQTLKLDARMVSKFPVIIEDCGKQKCIFNQQYNFFEKRPVPMKKLEERR